MERHEEFAVRLLELSFRAETLGMKPDDILTATLGALISYAMRRHPNAEVAALLRDVAGRIGQDARPADATVN